MDEKDNVLVFHRCSQQYPYGDPDSQCAKFSETIPWSPQAVAIRFLKGKDVLYIHPIESHKPQLKVQPVSMKDGLQPFKIRWSSENEHQLLYILRYSNDGGKSWKVIAANLKRTEMEIIPSVLPGGENCMIQIVASSGIRTVTAVTKLSPIPIKPRQAMIMTPRSTDVVKESEEISFMGTAYSCNFESCDLQEVVWTSNIDGVLGKGFTIVRRLSQGLHTITFTIPDGLGNVSIASTLLRVKEED